MPLYDSLDPGTRLFVDRLVDAAGPLAFGHDTDVVARYEEAMQDALIALRDFFRTAQMESDEATAHVPTKDDDNRR